MLDFSVCPRVREEKPSGEVPRLPSYRFFVALPEDIPGVHTKIYGHPLLPILGPITVIARGNFIYAWHENHRMRLFFNSEDKIIVVSTETGMMEPMTAEHTRIVTLLINFARSRAAALNQGRNQPN